MGSLGRAVAGSAADRASPGATAQAPRAHATSRAKPRRVNGSFIGVSGAAPGRGFVPTRRGTETIIVRTRPERPPNQRAIAGPKGPVSHAVGRGVRAADARTDGDPRSHGCCRFGTNDPPTTATRRGGLPWPTLFR